MSEKTFDTSQGDEPSPARSCQSQHQHWTGVIVRHEQEIDQLLLLLMELPEQHNSQSHNYHAKYYYSDLIRIKKVFQRLRQDMLCERSVCGLSSLYPCYKPQAGLYASMAVDAQLRILAGELAQIKYKCNQFY